jgi:hypothetical protein
MSEVSDWFEHYCVGNTAQISEDVLVSVTIFGRDRSFEIHGNFFPALKVTRTYGDAMLLHWPLASADTDDTLTDPSL